MGALLDDAAAVQDDDAVDVLEGVEAVGDDQRGAACGHRAQALVDLGLDHGVEGRRRLVERQLRMDEGRTLCFREAASGSTDPPVMTLGILGSGSGSNMQAILDAIDAGSLDAEIVLVLSDNPGAYILERAAKRGIPTALIDCHGFKTKFPDEAQTKTAAMLKEAGVDI